MTYFSVKFTLSFSQGMYFLGHLKNVADTVDHASDLLLLLFGHLGCIYQFLWSPHGHATESSSKGCGQSGSTPLPDLVHQILPAHTSSNWLKRGLPLERTWEQNKDYRVTRWKNLCPWINTWRRTTQERCLLCKQGINFALSLCDMEVYLLLFLMRVHCIYGTSCWQMALGWKNDIEVPSLGNVIQ